MSTPNNAVNNQTGTANTLAFHNHLRSASGQWHRYNDQTDVHGYYSGVGSPEGVVAADIGSIYTDTGAGFTGIYYKQTDTVNTGWVLQASGGTFSVVNQTVTATGAFTYTPTAGMVYVEVELVGGGGGSGGCAATVANTATSGSGGSGGYAKFILSAADVGVSLAGVVGAGGAGGAAGANNGANGSATTLATAAPWTVNGGGLGGGQVASTNSAANGADGGTVTTGTGNIIVAMTGGSGYPGKAESAGSAIGAGGGSNPLGQGGRGGAGAVAPFSQVGFAGTGYGSGAGGSVNFGTLGAITGQAGNDGIAIFKEYVIV